MIRIEIEDWIEGDLQKATTNEERQNISKRQALRDKIAELAEQDYQLCKEYDALPATKERKKREWDSMSEEQKAMYAFFSRRILEHAVNEVSLADFTQLRPRNKRSKKIRFFKDGVES